MWRLVSELIKNSFHNHEFILNIPQPVRKQEGLVLKEKEEGRRRKDKWRNNNGGVALVSLSRQRSSRASFHRIYLPVHFLTPPFCAPLYLCCVLLLLYAHAPSALPLLPPPRALYIMWRACNTTLTISSSACICLSFSRLCAYLSGSFAPCCARCRHARHQQTTRAARYRAEHFRTIWASCARYIPNLFSPERRQPVTRTVLSCDIVVFLYRITLAAGARAASRAARAYTALRAPCL